MEKKSFAKKYLISILALFLAGFAVAFVTQYALAGTGYSNLSLSFQQMLLISLLCACLPAGSYCGFVLWGMKVQKKNAPSKGLIVCVCIFFPILLALLTIFGIIMIIPSIIKSLSVLIRG